MTPPSTQWWSSPLPSPSRELLRSVSLHYPFNLTHNFTSYSQSWSVSCYLRSRPPALSLLIAPLRPISVLPSVVVSLHRMSWSLKKKKKITNQKTKLPHSIVSGTVLLHFYMFLLHLACYFVFTVAHVMPVTQKFLLNEKITVFFGGGCSIEIFPLSPLDCVVLVFLYNPSF